MTRSDLVTELVGELERLSAEVAAARERLHGLLNAVAALKERLASREVRGGSHEVLHRHG